MNKKAPIRITIGFETASKCVVKKSRETRLKKLEKGVVDDDIEYIRTDAFIERVINFLNYKLDDVVAIRVPGTIIPHHVAKQELIEDLKKYMKG